MSEQKHTGKVIFAGAGPGDPELITLKALRYLQQADVVITDRLVSDVILDEYVHKEALILPVGKQCRKGASTPQSVINELLVEYASQNKLVVRLKGGDPSVFSNILDELQALSRHGIPYEIIPGITAALGAAAYSGIPLTARDHSKAVRLLTYYKKDLLEDSYWKELALTDDTLVFYMSSDTLDSLVSVLLKHGIGADKYLSVIEQATTPYQQVYNCNIHDYPAKWGNSRYISPSLIIIGKTAGLYEEFQWIGNGEKKGESKESYFKPVADNPITQTKRA